MPLSSWTGPEKSDTALAPRTTSFSLGWRAGPGAGWASVQPSQGAAKSIDAAVNKAALRKIVKE